MPRNDEALVQTFGVTKIFRDFWHREKVAAVRQLDLEICPDEVFGLLGPNGSGKSTTIKMILGLLYPSKGYIRVFGRRPTDVRIKARLGFLPEESYLYPFLNAWETLDYYGRLFRQARPVRRKRIDMLLDMVGLANVAYRRVGEYSKGMQRRIGLAQALINDPDLLILDEPTSGLDPLGTRQFKDLIDQLRRRGKTIILCSHLLGDVEDVCDRVAILYGGQLQAQGKVEQLLSRYGLTQITAERLSPAAVEQIRSIVANDGGKAVLDVSAPREKLEALFLRIVAEARTERVTTGGAVGTGQVAQFLLAEDAEQGREVLDHLVAATEQEQSETRVGQDQAEPQPTAPQPVKGEVLNDLVAGPDEDKPKPPAPAPAPPQADRKVIDSLMGDDESGKENHDDA